MKTKLLCLVIFCSFLILVSSSCTKTVTHTQTVTITDTLTIRDTIIDTLKPTYPITGLWVGTYTMSGQPPLYFSFTIYPDGTISYKSKGINEYIFYANGTWTLSGSTFSYTVTTTNNPGGVQSTQSGTATFSNTGTLTNGVNKDNSSGLSSSWTMDRVN
jgi:hypothetical protein